MPTHHIPQGLHSVTPYLIVKDAARLLEFVRRAFDAQELFCSRRNDGTIAHALVKIGDAAIECAEAQPEWPATTTACHLYVSDADATYERALGAGATSLYPPADRFYGDRESGVKDPCGNAWFIATHREDVPPDELARRAAAALKA
ncbi:MAG TPA: VOC family protein [Opitutaceae bacterium]|jgi:PhnB protein|nr:VOC family protein [Opitutaceae bacterium]